MKIITVEGKDYISTEDFKRVLNEIGHIILGDVSEETLNKVYAVKKRCKYEIGVFGTKKPKEGE